MEIKGTGKRLIPKRDIDYLEELKANHSDPTASWGGTEVVANPTLAGTEGNLTGLQVGDTKYKVPEVINVVANPTLAGTEDPLTGLQVGDTKYKVPVFYEHNIFITSGTLKISFNAVLDNNTPLDYDGIKSLLANNNQISINFIPNVRGEDNNILSYYLYLYVSSGGTLIAQRSGIILSNGAFSDLGTVSTEYIYSNSSTINDYIRKIN